MKTNQCNVLILSAGRRVELLQAFKNELRIRFPYASVFATDLRPKLSAACQVADKSFAMPRVTEEGYLDRLLNLCIDQKVGLVVPTIDTELLGLALVREQFAAEGVNLVISEPSFIEICRDKRQTAVLFEQIGIDVPRIMNRENLTFPCFVKPYDGSRSVGAAKIQSAEDLNNAILANQNLIFMEYIDDSYHEYTVDVYFDKNSRLRCLVPRHRLEVRDGEISKGVTRKNHVYEYLLSRLEKLEGARGCLTVQIFVQPERRRYVGLEINPRFGGGYPLSYAAKANYPGWLIDEYLLHRDIPFFDMWEPDLLMLRYDAKVLVHGEN